MVLIYTHTNSPRLQYICHFIFADYYNTSFTITTNIEEFTNYDGVKINYSSIEITDLPAGRQGCKLQITNCSLLFEEGIKEQKAECFTTNGYKAFFKTAGDHPFDIFAATFYLISRYEEYLPHQKDMYGRYAHENSLAFKEGFLHQPLINIWLNDFIKSLQAFFPSFKIQNSKFKIITTYDIDIAWSYNNKGLIRHVGSLVKSLLTLNFSYFTDRLLVMTGNRKDPFDTYDWLDELHQRYNIQPIYFFLVPERNYMYDKNILPHKKAMQELIIRHAKKYNIAIHPSWQSGDNPSLIEEERDRLAKISGKQITTSRQHYIRFNLPEGYQRLIDIGITDDYSMGYGSINGFRASVASSFFWYDLKNEKQAELKIHPFCYMEANSFYEQHYSPEQAFEEMLHYYNACKEVGGTYISIWHNHMLGSNKMFEGWSEVYEQFFRHIDTNKNWEG